MRRPNGCFRWPSAFPLSTSLMVSPPSLSSGRACLANHFTGPATLLLNPLQLHHLTRSQHLTLHHPPSSLENCPIPGLGSPLTSLAAPSQSPGLAPFFSTGSLFVSVPQGVFFGSYFLLACFVLRISRWASSGPSVPAMGCTFCECV